MKIYGPYKRKDNRFHICIIYDDGHRQTKSYPRYLMEQHLNRELLPSETIDHIDNDKTNNNISNLQILSLKDNAKKQAALNPRKLYTFTCPQCNTPATKYLSDVVHNRKTGKSGPYCSRSCAGKATYKNPWRPAPGTTNY